jgi:hypothetical protein
MSGLEPLRLPHVSSLILEWGETMVPTHNADTIEKYN